MQFVCIFFHICRKFVFLIYLVENFMHFPAVKNSENQLRFDKVTESLKMGTFLRHNVH